MKKLSYGSAFRILRGEDIIEAVKDKYLLISPFDNELIRPTSYDLRVSHIIEYVRKDCYTGEDREDIRILDELAELIIYPGDAYLFLSECEFKFPRDMIANIGLRSRYSRLFNSGEYMGRIECGWEGRLILEVKNHSNSRAVKITYEEPIATLEIFQLALQPKTCEDDI